MTSPLNTDGVVDTAFTRLMSKLATQEPEWPIFNQGYEQVLQAIQDGGTFEFHGLTLTAPPGVYPPKRNSSTDFVVTHWDAAGLREKAGSFLEMGTGTGGLALYALKNGWRVRACDIDPLAVLAAENNAAANGLHLDVSLSDLFTAFKGLRFDAILFNFPLYHKESADWHERALSDANGQLTKRFFDEARDHLNDDGAVYFMYSNCSRGDLLERDDWDFKVVGADFDAVGRYWRALIVARPR
jgi:methylase of polypeptide subunit release factors